MNKNILWISRHSLSLTQENLLLSIFGKKKEIKQIDARFDSFEDFFNLYQDYSKTHCIFATISASWRKKLLQLEGPNSIGRITEPRLRRRGSKKFVMFQITYVDLENNKVLEKKIKESVGSKGYRNSRMRKCA